MAELKRKDEQLSTADLAGRSNLERNVAHRVDDPARPKPVQSESAELRETGIANQDRRITAPTPIDVERTGELRDQQPNASTPLFSESDQRDLRTRWSNVQTGFVDEPRQAVQEADNLVASVMKRLAEGFANERSNLEKQWDRGDNVSTEDLRVALQRYRSFFDRLLNA
jgi:hypothetical protein